MGLQGEHHYTEQCTKPAMATKSRKPFFSPSQTTGRKADAKARRKANTNAATTNEFHVEATTPSINISSSAAANNTTTNPSTTTSSGNPNHPISANTPRRCPNRILSSHADSPASCLNSIILWNCRGLFPKCDQTKIPLLNEMCERECPEILIGVESHLQPDIKL